MDIAPDGRHVILGWSDGSLRVLAVADGRMRRTFPAHDYVVHRVAISPDGSEVASFDYKSLRLWDLADGVLLWDSREAPGVSDGHSYWVTHVAVTPDGRYAISSANDGAVMVWRLPGGGLLRTLLRSGPGVHGMALSADGRHIAAGLVKGGIRVLRTSDGGQVKQLQDGPEIHSLALDASSRRIATCGGRGGIRLWSFGDGALLGTWGLEQGWVRVALTPDGEHVVASSPSDSTMSVWRASDGQLLRTFRVPNAKSCYAIRVTADGRYIVAGTNLGASGASVHLWRFEDGALMGSGHHDKVVRGIALHPDGRHVASASMDGTMKVWSIREDGRGGADLQPVRTLESEDGKFSAVTFTPDGTRIIAGGMDGSLSLWGVP